jgi:hypothetical protein
MTVLRAASTGRWYRLPGRALIGLVSISVVVIRVTRRWNMYLLVLISYGGACTVLGTSTREVVVYVGDTSTVVWVVVSCCWVSAVVKRGTRQGGSGRWRRLVLHNRTIRMMNDVKMYGWKLYNLKMGNHRRN